MARNVKADALTAFISGCERPLSTNATGVLKFTGEERKTEARFFFRDGKINSVEVSTVPSRLITRVLSSKVLSDEHEEIIEKKFSKDPSNVAIIDYLLTYQMVSEKIALGFVKEHFLNSVDEFMTWNIVKTEWREGEINPSLLIPQVEPSTVAEVSSKRQAHLEKIAEGYEIEKNEISFLAYRQTKDYEPSSKEIEIILQYATGEYNIFDVNARTGISLFVLEKEIYELWKLNILDVIYDKQFVINFSEKENASKMRDLTRGGDTPATGSILADPEMAAAVVDAIDEEENQLEEQINIQEKSVTQKTLEEELLPPLDSLIEEYENYNNPKEKVETSTMTDPIDPNQHVETDFAEIPSDNSTQEEPPEAVSSFLEALKGMKAKAEDAKQQVEAHDSALQELAKKFELLQSEKDDLESQRILWVGQAEKLQAEYDKTREFIKNLV